MSKSNKNLKSLTKVSSSSILGLVPQKEKPTNNKNKPLNNNINDNKNNDNKNNNNNSNNDRLIKAKTQTPPVQSLQSQTPQSKVKILNEQDKITNNNKRNLEQVEKVEDRPPKKIKSATIANDNNNKLVNTDNNNNSNNKNNNSNKINNNNVVYSDKNKNVESKTSANIKVVEPKSKPVKNNSNVDKLANNSNKLDKTASSNTNQNKLKLVDSINKESKTKQVESKQIELKQTKSKQSEPKQIEPKQIESKQIESKQIESKQIEPKQIESKQIEPKQQVIIKNGIVESKSLINSIVGNLDECSENQIQDNEKDSGISINYDDNTFGEEDIALLKDSYNSSVENNLKEIEKRQNTFNQINEFINNFKKFSNIKSKSPDNNYSIQELTEIIDSILNNITPSTEFKNEYTLFSKAVKRYSQVQKKFITLKYLKIANNKIKNYFKSIESIKELLENIKKEKNLMLTKEFLELLKLTINHQVIGSMDQAFLVMIEAANVNGGILSVGHFAKFTMIALATMSKVNMFMKQIKSNISEDISKLNKFIIKK